ncbi:hypothetical protein GCM10007170_22950 [Arthrobacter liuii]|uniref:Uncharacterized protein n=1 Tax=Arthrobacter liuii TaxID=1476996 RepID=A0ABQ2AUB9_9MICC|nr:hypothetical protein GCM10007170_22950 [Arthrobacter liuii]
MFHGRTAVKCHLAAAWLGLLALAYRLWIKGDGRRRAHLEDETSPLPVVSSVRTTALAGRRRN